MHGIIKMVEGQSMKQQQCEVRLDIWAVAALLNPTAWSEVRRKMASLHALVWGYQNANRPMKIPVGTGGLHRLPLQQWDHHIIRPDKPLRSRDQGGCRKYKVESGISFPLPHEEQY